MKNNLNLWLISIAVILFTAGCPPDHSILFYDINLNPVKVLQISKLDDSLQIELYGTGSISPDGYDNYILFLYVDISNKHSLKNIEFHADSINVLFNTTKMTAFRDFDIEKKSNHRYKISLRLKCNIYEVQRVAKQIGWTKEPTIAIDLSKFIYRDGEYLSIDTVYATDPRLIDYEKRRAE